MHKEAPDIQFQDIRLGALPLCDAGHHEKVILSNDPYT